MKIPSDYLKTFLYLAAISVALVMGYNYFFKSGGYTRVPKEVQIRYTDATFKAELDPAQTLEILRNPQRNAQAFGQLVYEFNRQMLLHVANRMDLSDSIKLAIVEEYENHHPYLRRMYFNDFVALQDTSSSLYQDWYNNEGANAVDILQEVASKYTCYLVNAILSTVLTTEEGKIFVSGKQVNTPCGIAMLEALQPTIARLREQASIHDFSRSKGYLEERIERAVAELATYELRDKKGISRSMQTKVWGFNVSSTDLEISAYSIIKVGFDLNKYFDIALDAGKKEVVVTLPEPHILSHEVLPRIDKLDIGWLREVQTIDFNKNINLLRQEFRREAMQDDLMGKAKTQVEDLLGTMLEPLVKGLGRNYTLKFRYRRMHQEEDDFKLPSQDDIFDRPPPTSGR
jgi:hypothetical protein